MKLVSAVAPIWNINFKNMKERIWHNTKSYEMIGLDEMIFEKNK